MKHGQGKITYSTNMGKRGKVSYQGEWKNDRPHGRGREIFLLPPGPSGGQPITRVFDGQFEDGIRHGFGILTDNFEDIEMERLDQMAKKQMKGQNDAARVFSDSMSGSMTPSS